MTSSHALRTSKSGKPNSRCKLKSVYPQALEPVPRGPLSMSPVAWEPRPSVEPAPTRNPTARSLLRRSDRSCQSIPGAGWRTPYLPICSGRAKTDSAFSVVPVRSENVLVLGIFLEVWFPGRSAHSPESHAKCGSLVVSDLRGETHDEVDGSTGPDAAPSRAGTRTVTGCICSCSVAVRGPGCNGSRCRVGAESTAGSARSTW